MLNAAKADKVLRSVYLDVIADQIDTTTSPFLNMISKGSEDICGKEVICPARFGLNGGIGCGADDSDLPVASPQTYLALKAPVVNIFGNIELSDKMLRASQNTVGSFVNLLNGEMESLVAAAKFNFARMLFQDGSGKLATIVGTGSTTTVLTVDTVKNVMEGMVIDVVKNKTTAVSTGHKIVAIDRANKTIKLDKAVSDKTTGNILVLQGSHDAEIYGLPYLYNAASETPTIYGNVRINVSYMLPQTKTVNAVSTDSVQELLDDIEERSGGRIDLLLTSYDMRRKYLAALQSTRTNVDYMNLDGGFKSISYNGIPIYADRFVEDNTIHFVNTADFKLQQLGDWSWIEGEGGRILRQLDNKAAYGATLVKYANLICIRPIGQAKMVYEEPTTTPDQSGNESGSDTQNG